MLPRPTLRTPTATRHLQSYEHPSSQRVRARSLAVPERLASWRGDGLPLLRGKREEGVVRAPRTQVLVDHRAQLLVLRVLHPAPPPATPRGPLLAGMSCGDAGSAARWVAAHKQCWLDAPRREDGALSCPLRTKVYEPSSLPPPRPRFAPPSPSEVLPPFSLCRLVWFGLVELLNPRNR